MSCNRRNKDKQKKREMEEHLGHNSDDQHKLIEPTDPAVWIDVLDESTIEDDRRASQQLLFEERLRGKLSCRQDEPDHMNGGASRTTIASREGESENAHRAAQNESREEVTSDLPTEQSLEQSVMTRPVTRSCGKQLGDARVMEGKASGNGPMKRPLQGAVPQPSTRRSTHGRNCVARNKTYNRKLVMPARYSSMKEATTAAVDAKLEELGPVRKIARCGQQKEAEPASKAKSTTETLAWNGGAAERPPPQSTARPAFDLGSHHVHAFLGATLRWTYEAFRTAVYIISPVAKFSVALILALGLLGVLFSVILQILFPFARSVPIGSIASVRSSICHLPGITLLSLPFCSQAKTVQKKATPVNFGQVMTVQDKFKDMLAWAEDGLAIPMDLKRNQMAMRSLSIAVRHSTLDSRDHLLSEFEIFVEVAALASDNCLTFNTHIGGTVDHVVHITRWTKRAIEEIEVRNATRGTLQSVIDTAMTQLGLTSSESVEEALLGRYIQHTRSVLAAINKLISEGKDLLGLLENLEGRLRSVELIAFDEEGKVKASEKAIKSQVWTLMGVNRVERERMEAQSRLLAAIKSKQKDAVVHVSRSIFLLKQIGSEMEQLSNQAEDSAAPPRQDDNPLSVQLETIQSGLKRLEAVRSSSFDRTIAFYSRKNQDGARQ